MYQPTQNEQAVGTYDLECVGRTHYAIKAYARKAAVVAQKPDCHIKYTVKISVYDIKFFKNFPSGIRLRTLRD